MKTKLNQPIEQEQITIDTFTVSIKTIQVNKKQMTLAVFRQLPVAEEDDACALWGIVRYSQNATFSGLWLVFSKNGKLFRRELDLRQRTIYQGLLTDAKRDLERHVRSYYEAHKDAPGYWDELSKTYSAEYVQDERSNHEKLRFEHEQKTRLLQKQVEEEEQDVFNEQKDEVTRYSYEHSLVKKLPQLFIAV